MAELIIAGIHPSYDSFLERWGSFFADVVIAFAIVGEILFARRDAKIQTELRRRSNDEVKNAVDKAAEIERKYGWRHILPDEYWQLVEDLREIAPSLDVYVEYQNGDSEAFSFANELALVFTAAGVPGKITGSPKIPIGFAAFGVEITASSGIDDVVIFVALRKAKIECVVKPYNSATLPKKHPPQNLLLFVGPKPPPPFLRPLPRDMHSNSTTISSSRELNI